MNNKYAVGDKVMYKGIAYTVVDFRIPEKKHEELVYDLAECDGDGEMLDVREFDISPFTTDKMEGWEIQEEKKLRKFTVSLQLDCRVDIEVMAEGAKETGREAELEDIDWRKVDLIETHLVNAYDHENDKLTDLY